MIIKQLSVLHLKAVSRCVTASERIVHLRTPKETTVGKIMDSCMKTLGMTEDRSLYTLKNKPGAQYSITNILHNLLSYINTKTYCIHILYILYGLILRFI